MNSLNEKGKFIDNYIAQIISRWLFIRGHSRKGGRKRNFPQCSTTARLFFDYLSQFMLTKSPEASSKDFS